MVDLQPTNILVSTTGKVKFGDFGIAKSFRSNDPAKPNHTEDVGADLYQSPEKKEGKDYDTQSDIYSMGMIPFELLYDMKTEDETWDNLDKLSKGLFPENFKGPKRNLVEKMLSRQPRDRPTLTEVLQVLQSEDFGGSGDFSLTELVQNRSSDLLNETLTKCEKAEGADELLRTNLAAAIHIKAGERDQAKMCVYKVLQKDGLNIHALRNKRLLSLQNEYVENKDAELIEAEAQAAQVLKAKIEYSYCITMVDNQSYAKSILSFRSVCQDPVFSSLPVVDRLLASWLYVKMLIRSFSLNIRDFHTFPKHKLIVETLIRLRVLAQASDPFALMQGSLWTAELLTKCKREFGSQSWRNAYRSQLGDLPSIRNCLLAAKKHCDQTKNARIGKLYNDLLDSTASKENIYNEIESCSYAALAINEKTILALWNLAHVNRDKWLDDYIKQEEICLNDKLNGDGSSKNIKNDVLRRPVVEKSSFRQQLLRQEKSQLEKLLAVTPTNQPARLELARVCFALKEDFGAVEMIFKDITKQSEGCEWKVLCDAYEQWGLCCVEMGHLKNAEDLFFKAILESAGKRWKPSLAHEKLKVLLRAQGNEGSNESVKKLEFAAAYMDDYQELSSINDLIHRLTADTCARAYEVADIFSNLAT